MNRWSEGGSCQLRPFPALPSQVPLLSRHDNPFPLPFRPRSSEVPILPGPVPSWPYFSPSRFSFDLMGVGQQSQAGVLAQKCKHIRRWFVHDRRRHLTPQPPREADRDPGRKQVSPPRKCSKMAAVMALTVLRRRITRWPQWACAGPVSGGSERTCPRRGTGRAGPGVEWSRGGPCRRRHSSKLSGAGLDDVRCSRLTGGVSGFTSACLVPAGPVLRGQKERLWVFCSLR